MMVNVAKSAGFCFGVRRALKIARDTAKSDESVCMLGDLVHNEDVLREIEEYGIGRLDAQSDGDIGVLLVCAHGAPRATIEKAQSDGYRIVDATCPMVREIHRIAVRMEQEGRRVIIVGDHDHDEVRGIVGQLQCSPIVVDSLESLPTEQLRALGKAAVVVQSTQHADKVDMILEEIGRLVPDLDVHNTICRPTRDKQSEMSAMPNENDVMIIIGSRRSANTRRLYEISKALNERTYLVSGRDDIDPAWLKDAGTVGVGAGASTPDRITKEIVECLKGM